MSKVPFILGQFDDLDVEWLSQVGSRHSMPSGTSLVRQGEHTDSLLIVLEGALDVSVEGLGTVAAMGPGEMIGEISFVDNAPPSATVSARSSVEILAIPKETIIDKIASDLGFGMRFYRAIALFLADRLRTNHHRQRQDAPHMSFAEAVAQADEATSLVGDRFDRLLRTLASA